MTTLLLTHPASAGHRPPEGHPERPARARAVEEALAAPAFAGLVREEAPRADEAALRLAHDPTMIAAVTAACELAARRGAPVPIDADTYATPGALEAALRGVGGALRAVDAVMDGAFATAFSASRPPGHHAERTRAMGFCLFNQAAVAALHALERWGAARAAVLDFDVHHGNGTQAIAWDDGRFLYASTHEWPLYPGTGAPDERGGSGNVVNATLDPGGPASAFRAAWEGAVLPALIAFRPDVVILSAGFDAHRLDPIGRQSLTGEDFAWATRRAMEAADLFGGRVVGVLEGGYSLAGLAEGVAAHVGALMGAPGVVAG